MHDASFETLRTSFGAVAAVYEEARPWWPAPTVAWLAGYDPEGPLVPLLEERRLQVLDLGAGTGHLTRTLVAAGCQVVAVDPSEGMLAELARSVPQADVRKGRAEDLPLEDACVDAVTVAQAWHWLDQPRAAAECARVLRPHGILGIAWHLRDERVPWVAELAHVAGRLSDSTTDETGPTPVLGPQFHPVHARVFAYEQRIDVDHLVRLASSLSYVQVRPDRDEVLARVRALGERVADADGRLVLPYWTRCYRAVRR